MSLDWDAEKVKPELRTYVWGKGEDDKQLHPKMHLLIWLTMVLRMSYTGTEKAKQEVLNRVQHIREKEPRLLRLNVSKEHLEQFPELWKGTNPETGEYLLTDEDVLTYWGLWTNAYYSDTKSFSRWKKWFDKNR
jgi:hypothetical protein